MLEESMSTVPSSIWASIFSWFTPTVFFVFLNITIGTIYFTSSLSSNKPAATEGGEEHEADNYNNHNPKLVRSPSVLQRLKSINLYSSYRSQEPVPASATGYGRIPDVDDAAAAASATVHHFSFQQYQTPHPQPQQEQDRDRSPSVLQRLKSINLYNYLSPEPTPLHKTQEVLYSSHYTPEAEQAPVQQVEQEEEEEEGKREEEEEIVQGEEKGFDEIYSELKESHHVVRTKSDTKPASGEVLTKLPRKMRKSASVKSAFSHFEEEDIVETRRPATVREGNKGKAGAAEEEDEEVDARADDFINKFKHQLKLQRIDSILRYKDMVKGGSER